MNEQQIDTSKWDIKDWKVYHYDMLAAMEHFRRQVDIANENIVRLTQQGGTPPETPKPLPQETVEAVIDKIEN